MNGTKKERMLEVFFRAFRGDALSVRDLANEYSVSTKSITRDINEIKCFLAENRELTGNAELVFVKAEHVYRLYLDEFLSEKELTSLIKVVIGARAYSANELLEITSKLKRFSMPETKRKMELLMRNEIRHYHPVKHDCDSVTEMLTRLANVIETHHEITVKYYKMNREYIERRLCPMSVMFAEYYFYLIAYNADDPDKSPRFFRVDRIRDLVCHRDTFSVNDRFDEGLLRERCQFMFPGELQTIRFEFSGPSVQAVLDRLPTAKVIKRTDDGKYVVEAEVYGSGIKLYLLSQGSWVKVLSPQSFVDEMREEIAKMAKTYS